MTMLGIVEENKSEFNENRSCIEIDLEKFAQGALSRLMKTEVVLKFIHTSKTPCQLCV